MKPSPITTALLILFFQIGTARLLFGQHDVQKTEKISPSLALQLSSGLQQEAIVVMTEQADISNANFIHGKDAKGEFVFNALREKASFTQKTLLQFLDAKKISSHPYWIVNAILVKADAALLEEIAARSDVEIILANASVRGGTPFSIQSAGTRDLTIPWGIDSIHAPAVWALGIKGQGAVIGGEDTGYDWQHPAIKNQYRGWDGSSADHNYNWHDAIHEVDWHNSGNNPCGVNLISPCDDYGHGTHTMGTMAGKDGDIEIGVAPEAKWIGERNMERGWGNLASYLESFEWFVAPTDLNNENADPTKSPHVINNSWYCAVEEGCDVNNFYLMEEVVDNVKASGIVVVASAGNDGPACNTIMFPPAVFGSSFTIGAVDFTMNAAGFSSRGNTLVNSINLMKPDVAAPGVDVLSCIPGNQYAYYSGTSMAGPHTAGTVALMISANPALAGEVDLIENILEETAQPVTTLDGCGNDLASSIPNNTYGFGIIDAYAAVQKAILTTNTQIAASDLSYINVYQTGNNAIFIQFAGIQDGGFFELYSMLGQQLIQLPLSTETTMVNISTLPAGLYAYRVIGGGKTTSGLIPRQ